MRYSLNASKGDYIGDDIGDCYRGYLGGYWEFRLWLMWDSRCLQGLIRMVGFIHDSPSKI